LYQPYGLYVDDDENDLYCDRHNHRIIAWKCGAKSGVVAAGENRQENRNNRLKYPQDVIVHKESDSLFICDTDNKRVVDRLVKMAMGEVKK
jgi:hypothetical protein